MNNETPTLFTKKVYKLVEKGLLSSFLYKSFIAYEKERKLKNEYINR